MNKYLIVGLGNPGEEYQGTRHNIGFDIVDDLASKFEAEFRVERFGLISSFALRTPINPPKG